jgi:hypothetical protein
VPAKAWTWLCRAYGSTTIRRAYADWADPRFGCYQRELERNGIDQMQVGHGPNRKHDSKGSRADAGRRHCDCQRYLASVNDFWSGDRLCLLGRPDRRLRANVPKVIYWSRRLGRRASASSAIRSAIAVIECLRWNCIGPCLVTPKFHGFGCRVGG